MIKRILSILSLLVIMVSFTFAGVEEELKKINQQLSNIEKRLGTMEKNIKAPPANNKKQQPKADPNAVYNIPVAGSVVWGNPNAKITITEFTDFQ